MANPQEPQPKFNVNPFLGVFILAGVIIGGAIGLLISQTPGTVWAGLTLGGLCGGMVQIAYGIWRGRRSSL